ncbi:MAG: hypothetical protein WD380_02200 [Gaiellaceae bacterium]
MTHGVVVGDVTARSAVLWARADRAATLNVTLSGGGDGPVERIAVGASDYTGTVTLDHSLAFGGDVAGQNVCRDTPEGFPIMDTIRECEPDVFVGLGDMIYADNALTPPAAGTGTARSAVSVSRSTWRASGSTGGITGAIALVSVR